MQCHRTLMPRYRQHGICILTVFFPVSYQTADFPYLAVRRRRHLPEILRQTRIITAMALQALAKYQDRDDVAEVIEEALNCLSEIQGPEGGYSSWGSTNSESVCQVIVALTELGIPLDDSRFYQKWLHAG